MKRFATLLASAALLSTGISAQVPSLVQYQGRLLDIGGVPVADADYEISLRFYDGCVGGTLLLTDTHDAVPTRDGVYSLVLGGGTLSAAVESDLQGVFTNHDVVCLGVTVDNDVEMTPRQRVLSAGYAMRAAIADNVPSAVSDSEDVLWTGSHSFQENTDWDDGSGLAWPHTTGSVPPDSKFRIFKFIANPSGQELHPNGEADEQFMYCYNCNGISTAREDTSQHAFNFKFEQTYFDGLQEFQEHNWNFENIDGYKWRPFAFRLRINGFCSISGDLCYTDGECGGGETCESRDEADFAWTSRQFGYCRDDHKITCSDNSDCPTGSCREDHTFLLRMDGRLESKKGIDIESWSANELNSTNGENGLKLTMQAAPTNLNGFVRGIVSFANFHEDAADGSGMHTLVGVDAQVDFSGDPSSRIVSQDMAAVLAIGRVDAVGGTDNAINRLSGLRAKNFFSGDNGTSITNAAGVRIATPDTTGSTVVQDHVGIRIENQLAIGTNLNSAILVESQSGSGSDGDTGNLRMAGGQALSGHLDLGGGHLWMHGSSGTLRFKDGVPTDDSDGDPIHSPPGTSANWGGMYWGDDTSSSHNSGDEVCTLANLTCLETYDMGSDTPGTCSNTNHATQRFMVLCY